MQGYGSAQFDRRRYPRLDYNFPLAFQTSTIKAAEGISQNASLGGLMVYLPHPVDAGCVLETTMLLTRPEGHVAIDVQAEVVWAKTGSFEGGWVCCAGLKFLAMSPDNLEKWRQFLSEWQGE